MSVLDRVYRVGPGDPRSPVILHVPHASRRIPPAVRAGILLDDGELSVELDRMTDACTDLVAQRTAAGARLRPWLFVNGYSRLVVDPERFPDEREEMRAVGMGAVYTHTSDGRPLRDPDPSTVDSLLATHFHPYADGMAALVDDRLAATGTAVVLDVHSYPSRALPYELHGTAPRPAVCLGTDPAHTTPALLGAARAAFAGYGDVGLDTPFAGCYVPLRHYGVEPGVSALMVEVRRDTYLTEPAGPPTGGLDALVAALTRLVDEVTLASRPG